MICLMEILIEEQLLTKYYVIKHLILPKIHIMMNVNVALLQLFIKFLTIEVNPYYDECQCGFTSIVKNFIKN